MDNTLLVVFVLSSLLASCVAGQGNSSSCPSVATCLECSECEVGASLQLLQVGIGVVRIQAADANGGVLTSKNSAAAREPHFAEHLALEYKWTRKGIEAYRNQGHSLDEIDNLNVGDRLTNRTRQNIGADLLNRYVDAAWLKLELGEAKETAVRLDPRGKSDAIFDFFDKNGNDVLEYEELLHCNFLFSSIIESVARASFTESSFRDMMAKLGGGTAMTKELFYRSHADEDIIDKDYKKMLEVKRQDNKSFVVGLAILAAFVVAALVSIYREGSCSDKGAPQKERDALWDVAKFALLCTVLAYHIMMWWSEPGFEIGMQFDWGMVPYRIQMPGFFVISGYVQQDSKLTWSSLQRLLRENILNNYMFAAILLAAQYTTSFDVRFDGSLWFLWALAFYRLLVFPCFKFFTDALGHVAGSMLCLCVTAILMWRFPPVEHSFLVRFLSQCLFLDPRVTHRLFENPLAYMIGLAINRERMRAIFGNPFTFVFAVILLIKSDSLSISMKVLLDSTNLCGFLARQVWVILLAHAFIACFAPLCTVRMQGSVLSQTLARCGMRTLYGYYIQMGLWFLVRSQTAWLALDYDFATLHVFPDLPNAGGAGGVASNLTTVISGVGGDGSVFADAPTLTVGSAGGYANSTMKVVLEVLFMAALCSPLAEACFKWLVSPQWILDFTNRISSSVQLTLSSSNKQEPQA